MASPATFKEFITLIKTGKDCFDTRYNPEAMGGASNNAYGGCAIAAALSAIFQTIPQAPTYHLYSMTGYYLGPANITHKLTCSVRRIRDTRTFATRTVEVSQDTGGAKGKRTVLFATADFQVAEPPMFEYSAAPTKKYSGVDQLLSSSKYYKSLVHENKISQKVYDKWSASFGLFRRWFEQKPCIEGIFAQTVMGIVKDVKTTQDHLPTTEKTSADWFKIRHPLNTNAEQLCAANFAMDASLAFMPLSHEHRYLDDAGACSSLDFALRIFSNRVDLNKWHFREMTTANAAEGRTYSEARLWDLEGNMVSSMTQQSIMRPKNEAAKI